MPDFMVLSFCQRAGKLSLSLALLVTVLGGCTTPPTMPTVPQVSTPTRLTFACPMDDKMIYQAVADTFHEAHLDIEVQIVPMEESASPRQLASSADTFLCHENCVEGEPAGLLLDLTSFLEASQETDERDFLPGLVERFNWQGGLWGLPAGVDLLVIFYDSVAFDDAGVTYPTAGWTWDDLLSQAQHLTQRKGKQVVRYGFADLLGGGLESVIEEQGAQIVDTSVEPPCPTLDAPRTVGAVKWYTNLALARGVMLNPTHAEGESPLSPLSEGRAAMAVGFASSWAAAVLNRPSLQIAPLPGKGPLMNVQGYFISAGTAHPEAAWCWLQFLSRRATPPDLLPARHSLIPESAFGATTAKDALAAFQYAVEHARPPVRPVVAQVWLFQALDQIWAGEAVEAALSTAQQKALTQATLATGSGIASPPTPVSPAKVTITFVTFWNQPLYEALAQAFRKTHPEIEVAVHATKEFPAHGYSPATIIAASHADCILTTAFSAEETYQIVLHLQPLIDTDPTFPLGDYDPLVLERVRHQGDLWGLPSQVAVDVLYYDKSLFDEAGLSYPTAGWTWDDWLAAVRKLSGGEGTEQRYGTVLWPGTKLATQLETMAGTLVDNSRVPTAFRFNAPEVVTAAQQLTDLVADGAVPVLKFESNDSYSLNNNLIRGGRVGMWTQTSLSVGMEWATYHGRRIGIAALPKGGRSITPHTVMAYYIAADTSHVEACWEWLKFVSDHIPKEGLPARRSLVTSDEFREYVGEEAQAAYLESLAYQHTHVFRDLEGLPGSRRAYTWLIQAAVGIVWHNAEPHAALDEAQQKAEAYMDCLRQRPNEDEAGAQACFQAVDKP